jgi:hypothetical protein
MADRIRVQVQYRKALWTCPTCKVEEWEDRPMEGGAEYTHTCKNGHKFNQSCGAMKEYNGTVNYTPEDYDKLDPKDLETAKQKPADDWLYSVKNPPPYVEPTKQELEKMLAEKQAEVASLASQISAKG